MHSPHSKPAAAEPNRGVGAALRKGAIWFGHAIRFFESGTGRAFIAVIGVIILVVVGRASSAQTQSIPLSDDSAKIITDDGPRIAPVARAEESRDAATVANVATDGGKTEEAAPSNDTRVDLNAASLEELKKLPGIGERRAQAILGLRAQIGRFRNIEQLLKVKGIGRGRLKRLRPLVRIELRTENAVPADAGPAKQT